MLCSGGKDRRLPWGRRAPFLQRNQRLDCFLSCSIVDPPLGTTTGGGGCGVGATGGVSASRKTLSFWKAWDTGPILL